MSKAWLSKHLTVALCALAMACSGESGPTFLGRVDIASVGADAAGGESDAGAVDSDVEVPPAQSRVRNIDREPLDETPAESSETTTLPRSTDGEAAPVPGGLGWPCVANRDCESSLCIDGPTGAVCTQNCIDDCPSGYDCRSVVMSDPDVVFLCVPEGPVLCRPCMTDSSCRERSAVCVDLGEGSYCATACRSDDECPDAYECAVDGRSGLCLPRSGSCSCEGSGAGGVRVCEVTVEPLEGGRTLTCEGTQRCSAGGWGMCELPSEVCNGADDDCDGDVDENFRNDEGLYATDQHCGRCNRDCTAFDYASATGSCAVEAGGVPACRLTCAPGFHDTDGLTANGCECPFVSALDLPGDGHDTNCDGVDGERTNAVFVARNGSDENEGKIHAPMLTLDAAVKRARARDVRDVLVATGVYAESIQLVEGISVHGGYASDFRAWSTILYETVLVGDESSELSGLINASNIRELPTVVSGFTILARSNRQPSGSSYGMVLTDCTDALAIRNNHVVGGDGGKGGRGADGRSGEDGLSGLPGMDATDIGTTECGHLDWLSGGGGGIMHCEGVDGPGRGADPRRQPAAARLGRRWRRWRQRRNRRARRRRPSGRPGRRARYPILVRDPGCPRRSGG